MNDQATPLTAAGRAALDTATSATAAALTTVPFHDLLALLRRYEHEVNTDAEPPYDAIDMMFATKSELASRPVETAADALVLFQWVNHEREVHGEDVSEHLEPVEAFLALLAATETTQAAAA